MVSPDCSILLQARLDLEMQALETASTGDAVQVVTFVHDLKRKTKAWAEAVKFGTNAQRLLQRQRYTFPETWMHSETLEGEWDAFSAILAKKDATIQTELTALQSKVRADFFDSTACRAVLTVSLTRWLRRARRWRQGFRPWLKNGPATNLSKATFRLSASPRPSPTLTVLSTLVRLDSYARQVPALVASCSNG